MPFASSRIASAASAARSDRVPLPRIAARRWMDLGQRVLAAVLMAPAFLVIAWRGEWYFVLLVNAIAMIGTVEFCRMLTAKGLRPQRALALAAAVVLPWLTYLRGGAYAEMGLVVVVLGILTAQLFRRDDDALVHIASSLLAVVYVSWLASYLVRLRQLPLAAGDPYVQGFNAVCFVLLVTWLADTGAYVIGSLLGRHKLAPHISPAKSVEGAIGGLVFAVVAGAVAAPWWLQGRSLPLVGAALGALAAACGLAGDLVESRLKRDARVKDSSSAIPGHGGALDRFDSVLFTTPLLYYVLRYLVR